MTHILRYGALIGSLMLGLACGAEPPTAPPPIITEPSPPNPPPPQQLPTGEPVATYVFSGRLDYAVSGFTSGSRYVLWDHGVFGLRYDAFSHVYLGTYREDKGTITFFFGQGAQEIATGTLTGDLLEVSYSAMMQHSDFEDAVYRRSQ